MEQKELEALVCLVNCPLLGPVKIRQLIDAFGSATGVLRANSDELTAISGIGPKLVQSLERTIQEGFWEKDLELVCREEVKLISFKDPRYPNRLKTLPDAPVLLYVKGEILPKDEESIAVIGTRAASIYGLEMAKKFGEDLARAKYTVVSGFARGVDTLAHEGALEAGRTIAVLGSGLANLYPKENLYLFDRVVANGAVISEYPMVTPPDKQRFPQRNRIVSGMTIGTLLIEAPAQSGAMLTMELAEKQGRKMYAIPGRIDVSTFRGNHLLLKSGRAKYIENVQDINSGFSDLFDQVPLKPKEKKGYSLSEEEQFFWNQLPEEEININHLVERTKLPIAKLNVLLMKLLLKRAVKEYPGKMYRKV